MINTDEVVLTQNEDGTYQVKIVQKLLDQSTGEYVDGTFTMQKCSVEFDENGMVTNILPFADKEEGKIILSVEENKNESN